MLKDSILEKLTTNHQKLKKPLNLGVYYKNTLIALCHALEDFVLESLDPPVIVSAFQRGKWYLQEAERYGELAEKSTDIVILAAPDTGFTDHPTSQKANVSLVNLPETDPVAQEWHLMILSPTYSAMVLCQELSEADYGPQGRPSHDLERKFYGFWTFEAELVRETLELTRDHIAKFQPDLAQTISNYLQSISEVFPDNSEAHLGDVVTKVVNYLETTQKNPYIQTKALTHNLSSNKIQAFLRMAQIIDQEDAANPQAAAEVASLAEAMGQILDLPAWQVRRLRLAGLLHRLPPLKGYKPQIENPVQEAVIKQKNSLSQQAVIRVLPQLQAIAKIITHQSESWDGSGGPDGLAYDNIPLESRILALVANFQRQLATLKQQSVPDYLNKALEHCQAESSKVYDPKLVQALELLVFGLMQGMDLGTSQPKIASGIWLIEEDTAGQPKLV